MALQQLVPLILSALMFPGAAGASELLVKLKDRGPGARIQTQLLTRLESALGRGSIESTRPLRTDRTIYVVKLARSAPLEHALSFLRAEPSIAHAEPNQLVHAFDSETPDDPDFSAAWGIKNTGQFSGQPGKPGADVHVEALWRRALHGSRRIVVAVIDSGIDWTHPDLAENLYANSKEAGPNASNGRDDDGNGFVDDVHGWNFSAGNNDTHDELGHGTHCAGVIGAVGNNGIGIAGVNWEVSLLPVKFLDAKGQGTIAGAIEAINYARLMKVDVMSNSWGGGGYSELLDQAIRHAAEAGILFVAAAGNDGGDNDAQPVYPATYAEPNVLAVAATDNLDRIAAFSNHGVRTVHVAAPGVKVYSALPGGSYGPMSGTSMAAPHVAGAAALLLSANPGWTFAELKQRLIAGSDPIQGLRNKVAARGRLNVSNAFLGLATPDPRPDEKLWQPVSQTYESRHPYANKENSTVSVSVPGARFIRVHFEKLELESVFDKLFVETPSGERLEELTGTADGRTSEYVEGDTLVLRLKTDYSTTRWGYRVDHVEVIR